MEAGTTVVITGASAGVGRATARVLARRGCRIGLIARGKERLEATRREILAAGGEADWVAADVADPQAVNAAAAHFEERLGPIAIWINSAMATVFSPLAEISATEFRRVVEVTLLGQVHGTMSALRYMRRRNRGTIVQVGSALAWRAIPLQSAYCAAKHGVRAFTDALRSELIHDRSAIRLTMVQLPALNTPQFDWGRNHLRRKPQPVPPIYQPEVAARAIVKAAERAPRELWVGGSSITAILASLFFASTIDRKLAGFGYTGQQSRDLADPAQPDNLFGPVAGDIDAHGRFDRSARSRGLSIGQDAAERLMLGTLGLAALGIAAGSLYRRR